MLRRVLQELKDRAIPVDDVGLRRPTLDDVFLSLTGHAAEEAAQSTDGQRGGSGGERREAREKEAVR
jgi:ABC-2 type transport system ATP-binding protein